ncbi:hypothetical protein CDCA_CDCA02G0492 [Cyanidium caldarium]|uniref:GB1/RHD3-type G domain-containing protein n=1 Tax=Cyanidium caldarium TaxID=2771 RepID=A0AAV9IQC1_CYACA|nr:hypothetical protein CDCA_CDCA02G0492 [Cyanidium caldarium]
MLVTETQLVLEDGTFQAWSAPFSTDGGEAAADEDAAAAQPFLVFAIVGCQGSGKSTLANELFGLHFPVLDAARTGRQRTTEGIWIAGRQRDGAQPALVVLDVEGTDSRERGAAGRGFESRTTLFTLSVADVVVLNMWVHDVGRPRGANYGLLTTVFSETRRLGDGNRLNRRPRLVLALRDYDADEHNLSELSALLTDDILRLWREATDTAAERFHDFFELDFSAVPSKIFQPEAFRRACAALYEREVAACLARLGARPKTIRLEALSVVMEATWAQLDENLSAGRQADGPPIALMEDMAAYYYCERIRHAVQRDGQQRLHELRLLLVSSYEPPRDFGERLLEVYRSAAKEYRWRARHYKTAKAAETKRQELERWLCAPEGGQLSQLFREYVGLTFRYFAARFDDDFATVLGGTQDFERRAAAMRRTCLDAFDAAVAQPAAVATEEVLPGADRIVQSERKRLERQIAEAIDERQRHGEAMLPALQTYGDVATGPSRRRSKPAWWKVFLIRAAILYLNYLQAKAQGNSLQKARRRREKDLPIGPTF